MSNTMLVKNKSGYKENVVKSKYYVEKGGISLNQKELLKWHFVISRISFTFAAS